MDRETKRPARGKWGAMVQPAAWWAFCGALLFGLVAHGMALLNKYSWHDDIFSLFLQGETITSGRWMLHVLGKLEILVFGDGHFSLPLMNGLFSLLCIGLSAGLLAMGLRLRSRGLGALLGSVMAAFPMLAALFGFMFAAPYYMLALLMMVAGALLIGGKHSWGAKVAGCLLSGCAVGVYQAFLPLLLTVILLADIRAIGEKEDALALGKRLLLQAVCVAGVMAIYLAGSHYFLNKYDLEMSPYMGLNQADTLPLTVYLERAGRAYGEFFRPTRNAPWDMYPQHAYYLYYFAMGVNLALGAAAVIRAWKQSRGKALLLALLLGLYPLGCNFIFVLSAEIHGLMVYGQVMHFALCILLVDQVRLRPGRWTRWASSAVTVALGLLCVMYARYDNECYFKTAFYQQEAISWDTALVTRIKSAPGFRDELPVAWVNRYEMQDTSLYNMEEMKGLSLTGYEETLEEYVNNWAWERFLQRWCGFDPETVDEAEVKTWPEVQAMPSYPAADSIQVIHDVVVVKFGEGSEGT
ncbi:MAG: glucosyltransferase domain-containing protein [Clostridia bacterium]|nr:glucosyltransferase domain-containing protein [Clostridia bacterium]